MAILRSITEFSWCGRLIVVMLAAAVAGVPSVAFGQHIAGTVVSETTEGSPGGIQGIQVTFLDAMNAETLGSTTTTFSGAYDSGLIPAGNYRVRFSDPYDVGFAAVFSGARGADSFCDASVVPVSLGGTSIVNEVMVPPQPIKIVPVDGGFRGLVRNAVTGAPLPGIEVTLLDAINATVIAIAETDADGAYAFGVKGAFISGTVRVRFFDPAGTFLPRFFVSGAAGPDDFCAGTTLGLGNVGPVDAFLEPVPPAQLTESLTEGIAELGLPSNVRSMLGTPLIQAVALLNDPNTSNDARYARG